MYLVFTRMPGGVTIKQFRFLLLSLVCQALPFPFACCSTSTGAMFCSNGNLPSCNRQYRSITFANTAGNISPTVNSFDFQLLRKQWHAARSTGVQHARQPHLRDQTFSPISPTRLEDESTALGQGYSSRAGCPVIRSGCPVTRSQVQPQQEQLENFLLQS